MAKVTYRLLSRDEVQSVMPPMGTIMEVVEDGLRAHGRREVVLPPKSHIDLDDRYNGHFNILVGWSEPVDTAGVKVVGDYVENYKYGLPSEVALLTLFEPRVGIPKAIMDATDVTTRRTGAVTGIGAKYLARKSSRIVGHLGARGTAFSNIESLMQTFEIEEVRINSKRPEDPRKAGRRDPIPAVPECRRRRQRRGHGPRRRHRDRSNASGKTHGPDQGRVAEARLSARYLRVGDGDGPGDGQTRLQGRRRRLGTVLQGRATVSDDRERRADPRYRAR